MKDFELGKPPALEFRSHHTYSGNEGLQTVPDHHHHHHHHLHCLRRPRNCPPHFSATPPFSTPTSMALTGSHSIGIPVVLLHECEALVITVELTNGEVCRGRLTRAEDCFNLHMNDCVMKTPDAAADRSIAKLFIRGDRVKMIICPSILENIPIFTRLNTFLTSKGRKVPKGIGRGKSVIERGAAYNNSGRGRGGGGRGRGRNAGTFGRGR
jgi:small nuclear ribonucleoprotein (snRNP)-like protein